LFNQSFGTQARKEHNDPSKKCDTVSRPDDGKWRGTKQGAEHHYSWAGIVTSLYATGKRNQFTTGIHMYLMSAVAGYHLIDQKTEMKTYGRNYTKHVIKRIKVYRTKWWEHMERIKQ
jgi:hypothetical protein